MNRKLVVFFIAFAIILAVDQIIKLIFLNGFNWESPWMSLTLAFNKGVAFSMFAFLGEYLKFIQTALILGVFYYLVKQKRILNDHAAPLGILLGAGSSNLLDRFIHGGVVDYVYWHHWFEFAIFNFADVAIDVAVFLIFLQSFKGKR